MFPWSLISASWLLDSFRYVALSHVFVIFHICHGVPPYLDQGQGSIGASKAGPADE